MFEILTFTEARLATLTSRVEKHGDEDKPAVSIGIEIETGNGILDLIDKSLRPTLYTKPEGQESLPEVEEVLQVLRCNSIDRVVLPLKHEGWTLDIDYGADERQTMTFGGCALAKFSVEPLQGGSIVPRFRINTSDLDAVRSGYLGMHVGQSIWLTLRAPRPGDDGADRGEPQSEREPDATDLFSAGAGDDEAGDGQTDADASDTRLEEPSGEARAEGTWPFPQAGASNEPPPQAIVTESKPRTRRGRQATADALAERVGAIE